MVQTRSPLGKFLYGFLFVAVAPALLSVWSRSTEHLFPPMVSSVPLGLALLVPGALLLAFGMWGLWVHGQGLPMNFAPPPTFVGRGAYSLTPHPIYAGFCLSCAGISLASGSASGFWLVTPVMVLCCWALVAGYEKLDLARRFPGQSRQTAILPAASGGKPTLQQRLRCFLHVFVPWGLLYGAAILRGVPADALNPYFSWEASIPVWEWTEVFYLSCYPVALLAPFIAPTADVLRQFTLRAWQAMSAAFFVFFVLPVSAEPRPFIPQGVLGELLAWERGLDTPAAAFPSFHVVWAVLAAWTFAQRWPRARVLWFAWGAAVSTSCITTGMHAVVDIVAALVLSVAVFRARAIWRIVRERAERAANSWRAWRVGPMRIINHAFYAGAAGFGGSLLGMQVAGPGNVHTFLAVIVFSLVAAGLWAQWLESSTGLQRPFGYYGAVLGAAVGLGLAGTFGVDAWTLAAAFAVGGPWTQAIGRVRCLVQGCCHGSPCDEALGIRYENAMSRVVTRSPWRGQPLHPTPLYSLAWNAGVGLVIGRLYIAGAGAPLLAGLYLVLNGVGRFAEEAYRGESQTRIFAGLRLYQWLAVASVVVGATLTAVPAHAMLPHEHFRVSYVVLAAIVGAVSAFLMGVDFPHSDRRFARLA